MTKQLALISLPAQDARPAGDDGEQAPSPATGPRSGGPRRPAGHTGWLDRRTIETGRQGVAAARAALADANRRAHQREQERDARREAELARQADVIRHPATRHGRAA